MSAREFFGIKLIPGAKPRQLYILLHGVGKDASDLLSLADKIQVVYPEAAFFIPDAPHPFDGGVTGRQWFSIRGVTEENRPARIKEAMPYLYDLVRDAQAEAGVFPQETALIGFSQGAFLALEYAAKYDGGVGRVLAFSGRYATLPARAPQLTTLHLFHGEEDKVVPVEHVYAAYQHLATLRGDATLDVASLTGHEINDALVNRAIQRLQTCVPLRSWERALGLEPYAKMLQAGDE
jgi:phospholipase/carboxylesterase